MSPMSRREFMKLGGAGLLATELALLGIDPARALRAAEGDPFAAQVDLELETIRQESHNSVDVLHVPHIDALPFAWGKAVEYSRANNRMTVLELAAGEHIRETRLELYLPEGARISLVGSQEGTTLRAGEKLAQGVRNAKEGSKDLYWAGSKHNLLKIVVDTGASLVLRDLDLDGGCEEAGTSGGYTAPPGPWNSIVRVLGAGLGMDYEPIRYMAGLRRGLVVAENFKSVQSIAPGLLVQNLRGFRGDQATGENVDCGVVVNWCDRFLLRNCGTKNGLSDGIYVISNGTGEIYDCWAESCRQGLDIQGGDSVIVDGFNSKDCAIGYRIGESQATQIGLQSLSLTHGDSAKCAMAYSIGRVKDGVVSDAKHSDLGGWLEGYTAEKFSHTGIAQVENILNEKRAVWYARDVPKPTLARVSGTVSPYAPQGYDATLSWPTI